MYITTDIINCAQVRSMELSRYNIKYNCMYCQTLLTLRSYEHRERRFFTKMIVQI